MRLADPAHGGRRSPRLAVALALTALVATAPAHRSAAQELATAGPDEPRRWHLIGDVGVRADEVERPAADDLERLRLRVRPGLRLAPSATVELRAEHALRYTRAAMSQVAGLVWTYEELRPVPGGAAARDHRRRAPRDPSRRSSPRSRAPTASRRAPRRPWQCPPPTSSPSHCAA